MFSTKINSAGGGALLQMNSKNPFFWHFPQLYPFDGQWLMLENQCNQSAFLLGGNLHEASISQLLTGRLWFDWPGMSCDLISRPLIGLACQTRRLTSDRLFLTIFVKIKKPLRTEDRMRFIVSQGLKFDPQKCTIMGHKSIIGAKKAEIHEAKMACHSPDGLIQ